MTQPRPAVVTHTQGAYEALFSPADPRGVSVGHRHAIALRIATLNEQPELAAHHRPSASTEVDDPVLAALLAHAELLTTKPAAATPADLQALRDVGLDETDIVTASQLIGFVNYQLRSFAALALLGA